MSSYLKQVIGALGKGGVLMPRLAQFLDREAIATSKDSTMKKRIVQKDSVLTIRCMRRRHYEFAHGSKKKSKEFMFHPSSIGQCLRKLWFEAFGADRDRRHKDDVLQTYMIFEFGTYLHVIFQNLCERAGLLVHREFQLHSAADRVEGTCDGILQIDGTKYVLEIKSINSGQWVKVQQEPKFEHKQQAMAYMHVLGLKWAIIVYINKDRGAMKEFVIEYNADFYQKHFADRANILRKSLVLKKPPKAEGTGPSTFPCSFCQYTSVCFTPDKLKAFTKALK